MKILPLIYNFNHTGYFLNNDKSPQKNGVSVCVQTKPSQLSFYTTQVNFKANDEYIFTRELLSLKDIHCPVCGVKLLNHKQMKNLLDTGSRIASPKSFVKFIEKNEEHIPVQYKKFLPSAQRTLAEYGTNDIDTLLEKMRDSAVIFSQNAIDGIKNSVINFQKNTPLSDSDNVLVDECIIRLNEFKPENYNDIQKPVVKIFYETINNLENEQAAKKLYTECYETIKPVSLYQKLFEKESKISKNVSYQYLVLQKLFGGAHSNIQKFYSNRAEGKDERLNSILICRDCRVPENNNIFKYHKNQQNIEQNFTRYLEDIGKNVLDKNFSSFKYYPVAIAKIIDKNSGGKVKIDFYQNKILKQVSINTFYEDKEKINFEPVNHPGIPCASCGGMTITHEQRLKLFEEIEKTKNLQELNEFLHKNEQYINFRYKPMLRLFDMALNANPDITERELVENFKLAASNNINNQLKSLLEIAEVLKKGLIPQDRILVQKYIDEVKKNYLNFTPNKQFPYKKYNTLLKETLFSVQDESFKSNYGPKFKETIRRRYTKQAVLFPNKDTVQKVGTVTKVIAQDMIKGSVATVDHLVARDRDGWEAMANYAVMCKNCNHEKTNYSFKHWCDLHPGIQKNMQNYIKKIIELIKTGELDEKKYEKYPYLFSRCVNKLSGGSVKIFFKRFHKDD